MIVPAGNKAKHLSLVNHSAKTIHHHQFITEIRSGYLEELFYADDLAFVHESLEGLTGK